MRERTSCGEKSKICVGGFPLLFSFHSAYGNFVTPFGACDLRSGDSRFSDVTTDCLPALPRVREHAGSSNGNAAAAIDGHAGIFRQYVRAPRFLLLGEGRAA